MGLKQGLLGLNGRAACWRRTPQYSQHTPYPVLFGGGKGQGAKGAKQPPTLRATHPAASQPMPCTDRSNGERLLAGPSLTAP